MIINHGTSNQKAESGTCVLKLQAAEHDHIFLPSYTRHTRM